MEPNIPPTDLQQAWQTAFQLRTCPDDTILRAPSPDENLSRHLASCSICREKRAMPVEQVNAWQSLFNKFAPLVHQAVNTPQPGQVWVLKRKLSLWGDDGYYYSPPNVLLLEKLDDKHGYRAAQLYFDKRLMGEGDVWLGDQFGFAQSWNSYTIHQDVLECWLGNVADNQIANVISAGSLKYAPVEEHSILSFFRKLEITVGSFVAVPSVMELMEEWEAALTPVTVNGWLENMFGSFAEVFKKLTNFEVPSIADTVSDLLSGARVSGLATNLSMASSLTSWPVNIVNKKTDGEIGIKTIGASITEDDWQDGTYFIAGKLDDEFPAGLHLLAWLSYNEKQIGECINQMTENSPYFDIMFRDVPKEACTLANVKFLLVSP